MKNESGKYGATPKMMAFTKPVNPPTRYFFKSSLHMISKPLVPFKKVPELGIAPKQKFSNYL